MGDIPFSNSTLLLISKSVLSEWQHHEPGAINQHDSTAVLWIYTDHRDVHILYKAILKTEKLLFAAAIFI